MATPPILPDTPENRTLTDNVHPTGWVNPQPATCYNLVVIGAGTAGLVCAAGAASLGARVALIEHEFMGGDCLNVGCVPSKAIIRAARAIAEAKNGAEFGIMGSEHLKPDFGAAMERMRRLRSAISPHDSARRFRDELGIDVFFGLGTFTEPKTIEVNSSALRFKKAAICTGARAATLPIPGLAEAGYLTNETVFSLTTLPPRLCIIGGGPIGCELAQVFARYGSRVTILEASPQILGREDPDAARIVHQALLRDGVEIRLGVKILQVKRQGAGRVVSIEVNGNQEELMVDELLLGAGRTPNVAGLGLEAAGIAYDEKQGVTVDDFLRTTNRHVYAAGDICSAYKFTHAADAMARIVIANALFHGRQRASSLIIPWCTYTAPEVAHVGMYERDATAKGIKVQTLTIPMADVDRAIVDGETDGFARVHLKAGTDRILGATIVAGHAGEMINELTLAMTTGIGLAAIGKTIHPYPTQAEAIKKLADAWNRSRLTPFIARIVKKWLTWRLS